MSMLPLQCVPLPLLHLLHRFSLPLLLFVQHFPLQLRD